MKEELTLFSPVLRKAYRVTNRRNVEEVDVLKETKCFLWVRLYRAHWNRLPQLRIVKEAKVSEDLQYFETEQLACAYARHGFMSRISQKENELRDQKVRLNMLDERLGDIGGSDIIAMEEDQLINYLNVSMREDEICETSQ